VVCFVTQQTNVGINAVEKLIMWADKVLTGTINQPTLPYAIIVLNGTRGHSDDWLDEEVATREIWSRMKQSSESSPEIRSIAAKWVMATVENSTDAPVDLYNLALHYFADIRFIYVPDKENASPNTFYKQLQQLYNRIAVGSTHIQSCKEMSWTQLNSNQLGVYFEWAFDHFGNHPEKPFDFYAVAKAKSPLPDGFGQHMTHLMDLIASESSQKRTEDEVAWQSRVASLLSSYISFATTGRDFSTCYLSLLH
jgi:hypothetical protein